MFCNLFAKLYSGDFSAEFSLAAFLNTQQIPIPICFVVVNLDVTKIHPLQSILLFAKCAPLRACSEAENKLSCGHSALQ
jgi:hypothetical protein